MGKIDILGLLPEEVQALIPESFRTSFRAVQLMTWICAHGIRDFSAMTNLPKGLREAASRAFRIGTFRLESARTSGDGDATKFVWRLEDDNRIETVHLVLPTRETFCISSQVGCAYGCTFCATAGMGFRRQLSSREIFEQVYQMKETLRRASGPPPSFNVVFMGMGEPLANYAAVIDAIRRLLHPNGLGLGEKRITISTCGLAPEIRRLAREGLRVGLAVSLNATRDEDRMRIMPVTRKYSIREVLDAAREYARASRRRVTFEYVLIADVNDSEQDADRLSRIARSLPSKVNLLSFNPFPGAAHSRPSDERFRAFVTRLMRHGPAVTIRSSRGTDIAAACGQLALIS